MAALTNTTSNTTMMRTFVKKEEIIIFTDVGEEIDDEIALFWLFNHSGTNANLTIVFTEGALNADVTPQQRFDTFHKYFPNAPNAIYIKDLSSLASIKGHKYSKMLQIAPLRGCGVDFFRDNTFGTLYLMGQRDIPSVNTCKTFGNESDHPVVWSEYKSQLKYLLNVPTIEIGTALSRKVPFTANIISKLPEEFRNQILYKAYEQFVGRVPAFLPFCYNVTFGANYHTLMAYVSGALKESFQAFKQGKEVSPLASDFYKSIKVKPELANSTEDIEKLNDMVLVVEFMTGGSYKNAALQKGSDNFDHYDTGYHSWKQKVIENNCSLTPAYDLLAMFVMVKGISKDTLNVQNAIHLTKELEKAFHC